MTNEIITYPPELLTKTHVAYLLSVSLREVATLTAEKKITVVDDGGKFNKFRLEDIRAYIKSLPEKGS